MPRPVWRPLRFEDLDPLCGVAAAVHPSLPERREVFEEKLRLFPAGCFALDSAGALAGYAISHPWRLYEVPPLDAFLERLPDASDGLYLHDVAVTPAARGHGAGAALIERLSDIARKKGLGAIALTSVYGSDALWRKLGFEAALDNRLAGKLNSYGSSATYMIVRV
ncbi:GNAT family N-acetyltransferase [Methylocystis parvus]|uniref:GNAT family N-acetyltransferase n=1 Tax=Methylocystis parvus TaxID=134 RepID=UPI003C77ED4E